MTLSKKRTGRITGSAIGAILGVSPFNRPEDVLRSMVRAYHGAESEFTGNAATQWGTFHEEHAIAQLGYDHDIYAIASDTFYIHPFHDWLGCTPDGVNDDYVTEIKCPYFIRNDEDPVFKTPEELPHYLAQAQYEMYCAGKKLCHFYQWTPHGDDLKTIEFDLSFINETLPKLKEFHDLYLSEIDNPEHLEPLIKEIPEHLAAEEYLALKEVLEATKKQMERCKEELIALADGKKAKIGGLSVYPVKKSGSISYAKAIKAISPDADLEPYRGKESSYWVVK